MWQVSEYGYLWSDPEFVASPQSFSSREAAEKAVEEKFDPNPFATKGNPNFIKIQADFSTHYVTNGWEEFTVFNDCKQVYGIIDPMTSMIVMLLKQKETAQWNLSQHYETVIQKGDTFRCKKEEKTYHYVGRYLTVK